MNELLVYQKWDHCLVYIDDVIIFSKSFQQHLEQLNDSLAVLNKANFTLNSPKCSLFQTTINYLGHTIHNNGITSLMNTIKALVELSYQRPNLSKMSMLGTTSDDDEEHTAEVNVLTRSAARARTTNDDKRITTTTDTHPNPGTNKKSRQLRPRNKTLNCQVSNNLVSAQSSTMKQQSSSNPAPS
ncbi:unnamed protein product [Didymodactylos carnosus]|uniref:Reverse transcriptase domain-containing protein n=1 Tax=Didymodactylos carnosus TaxID=1234261 RepID=A0A815QJS8_9BILA|nr:unnamed protein product [Didymodactylos carnosus]CAF4333789.1 unnamed protein product [Didymodactylos carnosus]